MASKEDVIQKYKEYKVKYKSIPKFEDFLKFAGIPKRQLVSLFGRDAYSKLQQECGDEANKLSLARMPTEAIMRQYGDLALKLGELPNSSDWRHFRLKPSIEGLRQDPHFIAWSEFPLKFSEWVRTEGINGYEKVINLIFSSSKANSITEERDHAFEKLSADIRAWSPGRRRNTEEGYKVELRGHLKSLGYEVNEEFGESNADLLVSKKFVVEAKKDPNRSEYDRLFGQLARHLQQQRFVIALVFDVPGEDNYNDFASLVDLYLNRGKKTVEIIKK